MRGQFISELRKKHRLSQESVAKQLGITRPTYIQIERGQRDLTITEAEKLSRLYGITLDDIRAGKVSAPEVAVEKSASETKARKAEAVRISIPQKNIEKFRQILIHILRKCGGKPNVGMTVLYKLLYFIDFDYYERYEEQLMGLVYRKNTHGPTPYYFDELIREMKAEGIIEEVKSKFYTFPQTKYLINPKTEPDLSILNGREIEHIEWEIGRLSDLTASMLSDLSHKDVPWISAGEGKPLDYEAVFYRTKDTSVRAYDGDED
jgi:transcriptional regulator with XRE-family HTH domain